jgi:hypothetical protein
MRITVSTPTPIPPCLQRTQIYLSQAERQGLQALALRSGRSQSALIREAIDAFLEQHQPQGRLARLRQARGLWAQRNDLPDWSALRTELDRAPEAEG